ncbi:MAG TPA: IclR family transcriptional regulator [Actinomycetota bacterium]|jgi:DNA-binding IclR family transcriptional regulator|nr:IclR family transcriptional regulator [Actinomycetota bacterium]
MPRTVQDEETFASLVDDNAAIQRGWSATAAPAPATGVGVLDRAVDVLDAVEGGARSFTAIADATGLTKPTAHRMITALQAHGFLMHVGGVGYALGPRLLNLASTALRELPLRQLARPSLEQLTRTTGESAQLYVRHGDRRICVDAVESENELRTIVQVGASLPLGRGSAGKVFLAWGPPSDEDVEDILQSIATTRRRGWADSYGEREPGVASVSAPIFGPHDHLLAAISVSGPRSRLAPLQAKRYGPAVVEAAKQVERLLGRS